MVVSIDEVSLKRESFFSLNRLSVAHGGRGARDIRAVMRLNAARVPGIVIAAAFAARLLSPHRRRGINDSYTPTRGTPLSTSRPARVIRTFIARPLCPGRMSSLSFLLTATWTRFHIIEET